MKLMIALAAFAAVMYGQTASQPAMKVAPPETPGMVATNSERPLTENEVLKLQLAIAKIELLQKKYEIEKYQAELKPLIADQEAVASAACQSVGIPKEKVRAECGLALASKGADGKEVPARVWWNRTAANPTAVTGPILPAKD